MKSFFSFGFPFLLRIIIPGSFASLAIAPVYECVFPYRLGSNFEFYIFFSIAVGLFCIFIGEHILRFYEGYWFWPEFLRKFCISRLQKKITHLQTVYDQTNDQIKRQVINGKLLRFPIKEIPTERVPRYQAEMPTLLGNILRAYEAYPNSRYGIKSIFFWPMFWLLLDKDARKEIEEQWVFAECLTYISFLSLILAVFYFLLYWFDQIGLISKVLFIIDPTAFKVMNLTRISAKKFIYVTMFGSLIANARITYLISLRHHLRNGAYFQAVFALKKNEVKETLLMKESDSEYWNEMWLYLRYKLIKCQKCKSFFPASYFKDDICNDCHTDNNDLKKS
ncbi:hypothetical protein [Geomonas propionica]|uniref:Uncharacterized protein n=1 Tax=Geomonas propionica TaxID=2798582 RepID=A0ABS0YV25_9BACT|nr:hypothetical protein [Geomonas propionica]MBJ6801823.1 hypothetical protein [Geomonas propionica]